MAATLLKHLRESLFQNDPTLIPEYAYGSVYRQQNNLPFDKSKLPKYSDNYGCKIFIPLLRYLELSQQPYPMTTERAKAAK